MLHVYEEYVKNPQLPCICYTSIQSRPILGGAVYTYKFEYHNSDGQLAAVSFYEVAAEEQKNAIVQVRMFASALKQSYDKRGEQSWQT